MDYFVLGQAALLGFVGLSILTVCVGFTVRVFLGPVMRDVAERLAQRAGGDHGALATRVDRLDDLLSAMESGIARLEAAQDFERRLGTGPRKSETA